MKLSRKKTNKQETQYLNSLDIQKRHGRKNITWRLKQHVSSPSDDNVIKLLIHPLLSSVICLPSPAVQYTSI